MWCEVAGARCAVGFSMFTLALDEAELGLVGRIQFVLPCDCDDTQIEAVLQAICGFMQRCGCSTASLVDQRAIPQAVLERSGFARTDEEVTLSLGVPEALAERFGDAASCMLDFL